MILEAMSCLRRVRPLKNQLTPREEYFVSRLARVAGIAISNLGEILFLSRIGK